MRLPWARSGEEPMGRLRGSPRPRCLPDTPTRAGATPAPMPPLSPMTPSGFTGFRSRSARQAPRPEDGPRQGASSSGGPRWARSFLLKSAIRLRLHPADDAALCRLPLDFPVWASVMSSCVRGPASQPSSQGHHDGDVGHRDHVRPCGAIPAPEGRAAFVQEGAGPAAPHRGGGRDRVAAGGGRAQPSGGVIDRFRV